MLVLNQLIKETELLSIVVLFADLPESKGRHMIVDNLKIIYLDKNLEEIEAINVLLHERAHLFNGDYHNVLALIPTYQGRIEFQAESDRIVNFLSLVNEEYPIDKNFNYIHYMQNACVPPQYEKLIKDTAQELYELNRERGIV